jgi:hypothetical protein
VSEKFKERMRNADPATFVTAQVYVDTNVVVEFDTLADILTVGDNHPTIADGLASPEFGYRQYRLKHSTLLMWWFAKNTIVASSLGNEIIDKVTGADGRPGLAVPPKYAQHALAKAIYHIVRPFVWQGWHMAASVTANHDLTGEDADDELLRLASEDNVPIITWEGFTQKGLNPNPKKLRDKCIARGVPVYTPAEYLKQQCVDIADQTQRFLFALNKGVREARRKKVLEGKDIVGKLIPVYRMILLDEIDPSYGNVQRPKPTWLT